MRPLYNRVSPAKGRVAQARFRRFVSQIASFPDLPAAERALAGRFRLRNATNDAYVPPSASRRTPRHVRHSENSQSVTYSRQKLPSHGSERAISPATRRAKTRVTGMLPCHTLQIIFRSQPKPGLSYPQPTADLPKPQPNSSRYRFKRNPRSNEAAARASRFAISLRGIDQRLGQPPPGCGAKPLSASGIPLDDAVVQERLGVGRVGVDHAELRLALGGLPHDGAQAPPGSTGEVKRHLKRVIASG